jgi:hypothetical protein
MRAAFLFALSMISTAVLAQDAPTAKRPNVGGKPLVQAKPSGPAGCKLAGTVKGTKLWAGDCVASELRTTTDDKYQVAIRSSGRRYSEGCAIVAY